MTDSHTKYITNILNFNYFTLFKFLKINLNIQAIKSFL